MVTGRREDGRRGWMPDGRARCRHRAPESRRLGSRHTSPVLASSLLAGMDSLLSGGGWSVSQIPRGVRAWCGLVVNQTAPAGLPWAARNEQGLTLTTEKDFFFSTERNAKHLHGQILRKRKSHQASDGFISKK